MRGGGWNKAQYLVLFRHTTFSQTKVFLFCFLHRIVFTGFSKRLIITSSISSKNTQPCFVAVGVLLYRTRISWALFGRLQVRKNHPQIVTVLIFQLRHFQTSELLIFVLHIWEKNKSPRWSYSDRKTQLIPYYGIRNICEFSLHKLYWRVLGNYEWWNSYEIVVAINLLLIWTPDMHNTMEKER